MHSVLPKRSGACCAIGTGRQLMSRSHILGVEFRREHGSLGGEARFAKLWISFPADAVRLGREVGKKKWAVLTVSFASQEGTSTRESRGSWRGPSVVD